MSSADEKESQWADLPTELLILILAHLNLVDTIHCGQVCKGWRSAVRRRRRRCHPRPPPLLLSSVRIEQNRGFLSLSQTRPRNLYVKLNLGLDEYPIDLYGPSKGWVLPLSREKKFASYLLNPITQQRIYLPELDRRRSIYTVAVSSSPGSKDCIVAAQATCFRAVMTWRPGQSQWTRVPTTPSLLCISMTFFNGRLYVIGKDCSTSVYEFDPLPRLTEKMPPPPNSIYQCWLVESSGELLMVGSVNVRRSRWHIAIEYVVRRFEVFKLEESGRGWVRIRSLGDRVLLLSDRGSESFSVKDHYMGRKFGAKFRGNCVCYQKRGSRSVLRYSLEDDRMYRFSVPRGRKGLCWFMPEEW